MWYSFEDKGFNLIPYEAVYIEANSKKEASDIFEELFDDRPFEKFSHGEKYWFGESDSLEEISVPVRENVDGSMEEFSHFLTRKNIKIIQKKLHHAMQN